jgi:uncharacterized membrane protein
MQIEILKTTMVGGQLVRAGATLAASAADARLLIGMGKAIAATVAAEIEPEAEPVEAPKRKPRTKVNTDGDLPADA